ncbi:MAG: AAA family ATPase [Bryobacteraceae bacterium]
MTLRGFKTIREWKDFDPGWVTVLIGPNGAGKSNFISFFRMLSCALTGNLQTYTAMQGGASLVLHDGPAITREIEAVLGIQAEPDSCEYGFRLSHAAGDTLVFAEEYIDLKHGEVKIASRQGPAHRESSLIARAEDGDKVARLVLDKLSRIIVHQFDNTSLQSRIRNKWNADDGRRLEEDGANLAPFLYRLQIHEPKYYRRILETLRLILPFFKSFELQPEYGYLLLRWHEEGSDRTFSASQAGDGMLRAMALVALLQQPETDLPDVLILDEPELGLHPYAIEVLAALIQSASHHTQVIVATQSVSLIDRFEPHDIVVIDRKGRKSTFRRLTDSEFSEWREQYTLSELWEKNVLGGRPSR